MDVAEGSVWGAHRRTRCHPGGIRLLMCWTAAWVGLDPGNGQNTVQNAHDIWTSIN
jgi:hypothetical protein